MVVKIYISCWIAFATTIGVLLVTGLFSTVAAVVCGFIMLPLVWFGMLGILPIIMVGHHHHAEKTVEQSVAPVAQTVQLKPAAAKRVGVLVSHN